MRILFKFVMVYNLYQWIKARFLSSLTDLGVPLDLSGASVHHWAREDGHDCGVRVQNSLLHNSVMLLNPHIQGHIIVLGEPS